jgi:hypothetical protein
MLLRFDVLCHGKEEHESSWMTKARFMFLYYIIIICADFCECHIVLAHHGYIFLCNT